MDGSWAQDIQILNENNGLLYNYHYTGGNNFTGSITVAPGTYLLEVAYKAQGSSSWYYAGSSNYSNPIYVIVEAPSILPDQYENNNLASQAYTLPISFSSNTVNKNTVGSNLHIGTDDDYYKINLPSGYNYTITARLHDSFNSGNGNTYSADGLFSYSTDGGSSWSDAYDDIMTGNIVIQNGGTVYFHTAPYFAGETGTYLLDMTINRTQTLGVDETTFSNLIKVYPNPTKDFVIIDLNELSDEVNSINILNIQGQQISSVKITGNEKSSKLSLQGLSDGVYFIQIQSAQEILTKKIIKGQ
ncbi:MAG: T9SS type A sorting domain-containing protein [Flavobacterium sp.]